MYKMEWIAQKLREFFEKLSEKKRSRASQSDSPTYKPEIPVSADLKERRILALIAGYGPAREDQRGGKRTLALANAILIGFDCTPEETFAYLEPWNESCSPPWTDEELRHKIDDATTLGSEPGYLLNAKQEKFEPIFDQHAHDACFTIKVGRWVESYVAGWSPVASDLLPEEPKPTIDLSDVGETMKAEKVRRPTLFDHPECPGDGFCPDPKGVYQRYENGGKDTARFFACHELRCPWCGDRCITEKQVWISHHLRRLRGTGPDGSDPPVYLFTVARASWERASRSIRNQGGNVWWTDVYAVGYQSGETLLAVSTCPPSTGDVKIVSIDRATEVMVRALQQINRNCRVRYYGHSQPWGNPFKEPEKEPECKTIGAITASMEQTERVLIECDRIPRNGQGKSRGLFYRSMDFDNAGVDPKQMLDNINAGHKIDSPSWIDAANGEDFTPYDLGVSFAASP